jgi:hypothetical protein
MATNCYGITTKYTQIITLIQSRGFCISPANNKYYRATHLSKNHLFNFGLDATATFLSCSYRTDGADASSCVYYADGVRADTLYVLASVSRQQSKRTYLVNVKVVSADGVVLDSSFTVWVTVYSSRRGSRDNNHYNSLPSNSFIADSPTHSDLTTLNEGRDNRNDDDRENNRGCDADKSCHNDHDHHDDDDDNNNEDDRSSSRAHCRSCYFPRFGRCPTRGNNWDDLEDRSAGRDDKFALDTTIAQDDTVQTSASSFPTAVVTISTIVGVLFLAALVLVFIIRRNRAAKRVAATLPMVAPPPPSFPAAIEAV